jgi:hypothetical protein
MSKLHIAVLVLATGFSSAALSDKVSAQTLTAEQRAACKADYNKYCSGTTPGGGRIIACLDKQHDALSGACRKVLDAQKQK